MLQIEKLTLTGFRNYDAARLKTAAPVVVLYGANGAGKTNVLEAISLLAPGRGLRGAELAEMKNSRTPENAAVNWSVGAEISHNGQPMKISTGLEADGKKRTLRIDGKDQTRQSVLAELLPMLWLTPQMDRLFLDQPSARRRFIDRIIFIFETAHLGRLARFEKTLRERTHLLQSGKPYDPLWVKQMEATLAQTGIAIAFARAQMAERLGDACLRFALPDADFPRPSARMEGFWEDDFKTRSALALEESYQSALEKSRPEDAYTGGTKTGPHRADLRVFHADSGLPADQCSTGEQKGLLLSLILATAQMIKAEKGVSPVLLLDEVAAHLDDRRRTALFGLLCGLQSQCWLTGTDRALFAGVSDRAQVFKVDQAQIHGLADTPA